VIGNPLQNAARKLPGFDPPSTQRHPSISAVVAARGRSRGGAVVAAADQPEPRRVDAAFAAPSSRTIPRAASPSSRDSLAAGQGLEAGTQPFMDYLATRSSVLSTTSPSMKRTVPAADG